MRIKKICIKNFRLLNEVELLLEETTTVIVGRNNCGKTSLSDVVRRFLHEKPIFEIADFSTASYDNFCEALNKFLAGEDESNIRTILPYIELKIHISYDLTAPNFGPLSDFIIDFDDTANEALVVCRYSIAGGAIPSLFKAHIQACYDIASKKIDQKSRLSLFKDLASSIPELYVPEWWAEDPADPTNTKEVSQSSIKSLFSCGFINAQRGLDGPNNRETDILAKILEGLFANASLATAEGEQRDIADGLEKAVDEIQTKIDQDFKNQLQRLMPTIAGFGYPGLEGQELHTETRLDVRRLLSNNTKVHYNGYSGVNLPESYNGLGIRNLLFILFQIVGFYRNFRSEPNAPGSHLIFIEEPEAHLHPQMQEVFIRSLESIANSLNDDPLNDAWPVQFVVSTHSSHIANETSFSSLRYFVVSSENQPVGVRKTRIKDLRLGLEDQPEENIKFLHQYLTLTRCDLFFADKAVLVEGTSERLMIPQIIRNIHTASPNLKIASQYITLMEVGGAYSYLFIPLIEFLELKTLFITDIDSVKPITKDGKTRLHSCVVHESQFTTNATIKRWFNDKKISPDTLISKTSSQKTESLRRIAYQCPEANGDGCGRSFEDAFILTNKNIFNLKGNTKEELEIEARKKADKYDKSDFALKYALNNSGWIAPRYIREGLEWLAAGSNSATIDPGLALVAQAVAGVGGVSLGDSSNA